ncbi:MAG: UDP-N-acetylmuramate--L-alanine ligase [bacterium]|nr:UDP-N-acetylmuramate--L-alanine ligase [bacterium]
MPKPGNIHRVHLIGIKGAGMVALAQLLLADGLEVSGSDTAESFFTDETLNKLGIISQLFSSSNITDDIDLVIYSTAWVDHEEYKTAKNKHIPMISYAQAIADRFNDAYGIAVCGSHGKTTTVAMLAYVMAELGKDPTAVIGSLVKQFGTNALVGSSEYFVLEADEYQNKFSLYEPRATIVTSIDYDHPDFFKTPEEYEQVFIDFLKKDSQQHIVACIDNGGVSQACKYVLNKKITTYGWSMDAQFRASNYHVQDGCGVFEVLYDEQNLGEFRTALVGQHNATNALAVLTMCCCLDIPLDASFTQALASFAGTARRFEMKGVIGNTIIIDDYAHHPVEVQAALKAAKVHYVDKRIWCVFVPHTFSRTQALMDEFARSFQMVDKVIVLDIYSSARESVGEVSSQDLVKKINEISCNAMHIHTNEEATAYLADHLDDIDVLITMGAGDVWKVGVSLIEQLS